MNKIYFIGAGPGDPELITIKGKKIIDAADVIIYAGSLVNEKILKDKKKSALVYNSATMNLDEIISIIKDAIKNNLLVARVHTGDPGIYGAIREQIEELKTNNIESEIIPGVSSFNAAAAVLKKEFTVPGISQTVILTRLEGETPVPENEKLELLASHKASMVVFLSVGMIEKVVNSLSIHYKSDTPVVVIQKATWKEQKIVQGTLEDIVNKIKESGIKKTALILVGDFLGENFEFSKLYDKAFSHEFRKAK